MISYFLSLGGRGQAYCVPHVRRHGGGSTGVDQAPDAVHQPQPVLRYPSTKKEKGAQQELVLKRRSAQLLSWISVKLCYACVAAPPTTQQQNTYS